MPHKNIGQKIKDFIFTNPTEEMVGLPPAPMQGHMTKSEEIKEIRHAFEHPLGEHHPHHPHTKQEEETKNANTHHHKSFGKKVKDFLFEAPTEETLGLPHGHQFTKSEALHDIHDALEHPFAKKHDFEYHDDDNNNNTK